MKPLHEIKRDVVRACQLLDRREFVAGRDGNISCRVSAESIVVTPAGMRKGDVGVEHLLLVDREGRKVAGRGKPSTEIGMHLRIYDRRPDVRAVVHAHPPVATGFAAAGKGIAACVLPEVIVGLGAVPVVPFAIPGTRALADVLEPFLPGHDAFLLENHGAVAVGDDVDSAYQRMETVEHSARILLTARLLGGAQTLPFTDVRKLVESRSRYGVREGLAACDAAEANSEAEVRVIVERVLEVLSRRDPRFLS